MDFLCFSKAYTCTNSNGSLLLSCTAVLYVWIEGGFILMAFSGVIHPELTGPYVEETCHKIVLHEESILRNGL